MKKFKRMLPYITILALVFYLLPLIIKNTGIAIMTMLVLIPLITIFVSIVFGVKQGFSPLYVLLVAAIFTPSIFIYYNSSAWVYIIIYGVLAMAGNGIGRIFYKKS